MNAVAASFSLTRSDLVQSRSVRIFLGCSALTICMALGAMARIPLPFTPVPITLQVFFVLFGAMAMRRYALVSQASYLAIGAMGLPVFANFAGGVEALRGVTAGYLFGFVLTTFIIGRFLPEDVTPFNIKAFLVLLSGMFSYYIPAVLWLKCVTGMSYQGAIIAGFVPFIFVDTAKLMLACALYHSIRKRLKELF
jgi:biotin transport system substrate-specific component